jgi:hypothetical protein
VNEAILLALAEGPDWHTAGAVSWTTGEGAFGTLGTDPAPGVAAALEGLVATGEVVRHPTCPVCGLPGEVFALAGRVPAPPADPDPMSEEVIGEAMEPLIAEGLIEVAEVIELQEKACCVRTTRFWRRTPRPA